MTDRCRATKSNGEPCRGTSTSPHGLCWAHAPENQERRRRGQSRGGRNKPSRELVDLKGRLSVLAEDVLAGNVDRGNSAVAAQVLKVYLRTIETERKLRETDELARRLEELEGLLENRKGEGWWGA